MCDIIEKPKVVSESASQQRTRLYGRKKDLNIIKYSFFWDIKEFLCVHLKAHKPLENVLNDIYESEARLQ